MVIATSGSLTPSLMLSASISRAEIGAAFRAASKLGRAMPSSSLASSLTFWKLMKKRGMYASGSKGTLPTTASCRHSCESPALRPQLADEWLSSVKCFTPYRTGRECPMGGPATVEAEGRHQNQTPTPSDSFEQLVPITRLSRPQRHRLWPKEPFHRSYPL
jgi:hypothetical protein